MAASQHMVDDLMARAVAEFDTNPLSSQLLRHLSNVGPEQFCCAALKYLETDEHSDAHRFLTELMLRQPSRFDYLMNPRYGSLERAIRICRRLVAVDPAFDLKLARRLPESPRGGEFGLYESLSAARTIEILDATSPGRRLLPILGSLVHSPDARMSEKAILFVGRRLLNPDWAGRQLKRDDPRIRANAVESIWGVNSTRAKSLFERCLEDSSSRVRGNSLVGLHLIGTPGVVGQVGLLAVDANHRFRSTAAWTMGRIGDPIFVPELNTLIRDAHPQVRGTALRSLIEIRRIESKTAQANAAPDGGKRS